MILPRGITGFDVSEGQPTPDPKGFLADCWQVALALGGRIDERPQVLAGYPANFISQGLVLPDRAVTALLNLAHPWVGLCRPLQSWGDRLEFTEAGRVRAGFAELGRYRVLSEAELELPVGAAMCAELGRGELAQLKYWEKVAGHGKLRVGEVVFNFWD